MAYRPATVMAESRAAALAALLGNGELGILDRRRRRPRAGGSQLFALFLRGVARRVSRTTRLGRQSAISSGTSCGMARAFGTRNCEPAHGSGQAARVARLHCGDL
jgi:hypothetical protein